MIGSIHRHLWQRLPYGLRRRALFSLTAFAAPRAAAGAVAEPPLIVAGALRTASGLGHSARLCLQALREAGVPAVALDITAALRQEAGLPPPGGNTEVLEGPGTVVLHVNAPLTGLALLAIGRRRVAEKRIVGYWAWELPKVPPEWRLGIRLVHEIWVPSTFTAAAIAPIADGRPVHVVPHPVALGARKPPAPRAAGAPFTVLTMLDAQSSIARKNPEGAIEAFRRAFGDDPAARLLVKTQHLARVPDLAARIFALAQAPNITLLDATLDEAGLDSLYAQADVLLSLHRAEGFGLTLAEAMRRGLPVVATGWSGNADFLTGEVGVPVPWRMVPATDPQRTYHHPTLGWAEPDLDAAALALRALRGDPDRRARLGAAATAWAEAQWSAGAYAARLRGIGAPV